MTEKTAIYLNHAMEGLARGDSPEAVLTQHVYFGISRTRA